MKRKLLFTAALATTFIATTQAQTFTNASFETWNSYTVSGLSLEAPTGGWYGVDSLIKAISPIAGLSGITITAQKQLFKSTVAHTGSFSAEVKSAFIGDSVGNVPGIFSNAQIGIDILGALAAGSSADLLQFVTFSGGTSVTAQVDTVKAWVQLDHATSSDTAVVNVSAVKTVPSSSGSDSTAVLGTGTGLIYPGDSTFVQIAVPVIYLDATVPQRLIVTFMSSNFASDTVHSGNDLKVDDVSYTYKAGTSSINQPLLSENRILVYPNPATNQVYFNLSADVKATDYSLSVFDINGRLVSQEQLKQAINVKNVSSWSKGHYFYQLNDMKSGKMEHGKFIVE